MGKEKTADREINTSRILAAPRELIWNAWTDPEQIGRWWGPRGFSTTTEKMDLKPNGVWLFVMHGPDGRDYKNKIIYLEVNKPERLVYRHAGDEETEPVNFHVTVTFTEQGNKTILKLKSEFESAEELQRVDREYGAIEGLHETLGRLEEYLTQQTGSVR